MKLRAILALFLLCCHSAVAAERNHFRIQITDTQTGRGVPFVELGTTSGERFHTDSNGLIAIDSPELMNRPTWFSVASHGYEHPKVMGFAGTRLTPTPGGLAEIKLTRVNIAERLYRITGAGSYRDTVLLGEQAPIDEPLLNAEITGQDSVLATIYQGEIFWVWGDTARLSFPLGNFSTSGARSLLPDKGGLDPSVGINLRYFVDSGGFAKRLVPLDRPGLVWTDGLLAINDNTGRERLFAHYVRMKDIMTLEETGYMVWDDERREFEVIKQLPLDTPLMAGSHPIRARVAGEEYFYFPGVYPLPEAYAHIRVRADWESLLDPKRYEGFTCLKPGSRYEKDNPALDRDDAGELVWAWKRDTAALTRPQLDELIASGRIERSESPVRLVDVDSGEPLTMFGGSIQWNDYRQKWILTTVNCLPEGWPGGEVYFAEANAPEGPWVHAKKIATHSAPGEGEAADDNYDFYNPVHHPFFDQEGGRVIYFEGTLSTYFAKNQRAAPRYSYNQLMYRVDLADPRLKLPEPPPAMTSPMPRPGT